MGKAQPIVIVLVENTHVLAHTAPTRTLVPLKHQIKGRTWVSSVSEWLEIRNMCW